MKPMFFRTPSAFRKWLATHHQKHVELWVGFYKVTSGLASITWPQSVDEALCFGWIDGVRKSIDDRSYMIRFTPRRSTSIWSAKNIQRFAELKAQGLIHPAGQEAFDKIQETHTRRYSFEQDTLHLLPEYEKQLQANVKAWTYFQSLPPSVKKPTIWWVMSAKRKETQLRRLGIVLDSCTQQQRIPPLRLTRR